MFKLDDIPVKFGLLRASENVGNNINPNTSSRSDVNTVQLCGIFGR